MNRGPEWKDGYDAGRRVHQAELDKARNARDRLAHALSRLVADVEVHGALHRHGAALLAAHAVLERPETRSR